MADFLPLQRGDFDAAIIDLDGTMVDTMGDFVQALNRMLADVALPPITAVEVKRMVGKGSEHLIQSVLNHTLALDGQDFIAIKTIAITAEAIYPKAWASYQRHYQEINGQYSHVYPGVLEGLQALQAAGLPLACLTNKPTAFARALLHAKGLEGFFVEVFGGDTFERKKPDPLPLYKTCEALGSTPARTLMVGDSCNDAQAARAAGCKVVLVTYGYNHGAPVLNVDADGWVDSMADIWGV